MFGPPSTLLSPTQFPGLVNPPHLIYSQLLFQIRSFPGHYHLFLGSDHIWALQSDSSFRPPLCLFSDCINRMVREENWEGFIADTLLFGKVFLFLLALNVDHHLALWYILAFLVLYIIAEQPAFPELGTVNTLTPLQLETTLMEGSTSRYWLVEFRALYSSSCVRNSRIFPELSVTYSNKNLSFGMVDLGLFPNVAERYGISLTGNLGLPTYILFENNVEVMRFPGVDLEGKVSHQLATKKYLSQHFALDMLLLEYVTGK